MENKNTRIGLAWWEWILSILALLIFLSFIALPPIFRLVFQEESPEIPPIVTPIPTEDDTEPIIDDSMYEKVICSKMDSSSDHYRQTLGVLLFHENDKLRIVSETSNRIYPLDTQENEALFAKDKLTCDHIPDSYKRVKGFNYECSSGGDSVYTVQKFDLARFTATSVVDDDNIAKDVDTSYFYDQDLVSVREDLTLQGYTCE